MTGSGSSGRFLLSLAAVILLLAPAMEIDARGGRGGGGFRGGGGARGGISRGGPARGGSVRHERSGGSYRSGRADTSWAGQRSASPSRERRPEPGQTVEREGSFESRRGETIDYSGSATRTEDGIRREGSWTSSSGASGGGSGEAKISEGRVQSTDRSRHAQNADGETIQREIQSERHGDHVDREAQIKSSTGIDAESKGTIRKGDDGFVARGVVVGKDGAAGGTIARKGDQTIVRGAATDGKHVTWGGAHCTGSRCYGGRTTVKVKDYYGHRYYYYPYYYGWYSCPYGSVRTWYSRYGSPVYGCSNVVVVHTTISLGSTEPSSFSAADASSLAPANVISSPEERAWSREAEVSSAPVLMYEVNDDVVAYRTTYPPDGVYALKYGELYYWVPGPAAESEMAKEWSAEAERMPEPTANSAVITYTVGERTVYLTNERPVPPFFTETADYLFVWIPGVVDPTDEERELIREVVTAHQAGGNDALDREVRKLEKGRDPPPDAA